MISQIKWVDIKFNFDILAGKYPALVERLAGTPARVEEKINNAPYMILATPHNNGWSIQEHVGHLIDLDLLLSARLDDFDNKAATLTPADMTNKKTYDADYNNASMKSLLKEFRNSRSAIIERIKNYDEEKILSVAQHPRLNKPMRLIDLIYFFAEHDDHHLAIISCIEEKLK